MLTGSHVLQVVVAQLCLLCVMRCYLVCVCVCTCVIVGDMSFNSYLREGGGNGGNGGGYSGGGNTASNKNFNNGYVKGEGFGGGAFALYTVGVEF